jgi:ribosomal protein L10
MQSKNFKNNKINQLQYIKKNYDYVYIFRYNGLNTNEIITIKKQIKNLNYKSLVIKQTLTNNFFSNLKGQGSLFIIYSNKYKNLIKELSIFKKLELIKLVTFNDVIYSNLKIKKILSDPKNFLNIKLIKPFLNFIYYLRKI